MKDIVEFDSGIATEAESVYGGIIPIRLINMYIFLNNIL